MITPLSSKEFNLLPVYVYMAQSYKHQNVISPEFASKKPKKVDIGFQKSLDFSGIFSFSY